MENTYNGDTVQEVTDPQQHSLQIHETEGQWLMISEDDQALYNEVSEEAETGHYTANSYGEDEDEDDNDEDDDNNEDDDDEDDDKHPSRDWGDIDPQHNNGPFGDDNEPTAPGSAV